jgi:hypothetical protein
MRTVMFLIGGLVLFAACIAVARLAFAGFAGATLIATLSFLALWLAVAGANMWFGVSRAGYSVAEELPIFGLIFGLPAVVACLVKWQLL